MLSDIEICRNTPLSSITHVAEHAGLLPHEFDTYGKHKAKVSEKCMQRLSSNINGKLVLVTAITPTPLGEGKTVTTIGLAQGLSKINQ